MNEKIGLLKDLRIAYECAISYDHVPDEGKSHELIHEILPDYIDVSEARLKAILNKYEGNSDGNIRDLIIDAIDELEYNA